MIRPATLQDLDECQRMLLAFAGASLVDYHNWSEQDLAVARHRLITMIKSHYLMVGQKGDKLVCMIGAMKEQDPWISSRTRMREMFWWVEPEYRRSRVSAELFLRWQQDCERFIRDKLVDQVSLSTQPGSSDIDLSHRGWRCVENHWIKE